MEKKAIRRKKYRHNQQDRIMKKLAKNLDNFRLRVMAELDEIKKQLNIK